MPKKIFPYNQHGHSGTYPWTWAWDVPTSKGTGTPYVVSVRRMTTTNEVIWGCNCQAGRNGHPICQHRQRVMYEIVTVEDMLRNLPENIRELVAPNLKVVQPNIRATGDRAVDLHNNDRRIKVVM